ncbi:MAG TPA: CHASE3 domain-containing protein [Mycobacteriales bacterium]|nr:CHASE3 domain-containing protein [Mycobacteriales bacterium]
MRAGLTRRMLVASSVLALIVGATFAVLLSSVADLRRAEERATRSHDVLVTANRLERLAVDLETGQRGFVITGQERYLQPWRAARGAFMGQAGALSRLVADNPRQQRRVQTIARAYTSYVRDYSDPLIDTARRDPKAARTLAATDEGKRRMDGIRAEFDRLTASEAAISGTLQRRSDTAARRAIAAAAGGLAGSILLVVAFAGYLTRAIVRPVRRAATMAGRLAGGDLGTRMPARGAGEIGVLERSFNTMAGSLEESRAELTASRARIVTAADQARRRIERDLHDGTQQRLVSLVLDLRAAESRLPPDPGLRAQLAHVADGLTDALDDLRDLSRGIHPAILSEGGLGPALKALGRRSVVPVELDVDIPPRLPEPVEVAAYYVVSEALTNAAKHACASVVDIALVVGAGSLHLSVRDDGVGGAVRGRGSGLVGLTDRVEALGGTISLVSPAGQGTALSADLPLDGR